MTKWERRLLIALILMGLYFPARIAVTIMQNHTNSARVVCE